MFKTKDAIASENRLTESVSVYESPACMSVDISVSGPLCQSGPLADPQVALGDELDLGFGGDL